MVWISRCIYSIDFFQRFAVPPEMPKCHSKKKKKKGHYCNCLQFRGIQDFAATLSSPTQKRNQWARTNLERVHKDDQRAVAPLLRGAEFGLLNLEKTLLWLSSI